MSKEQKRREISRLERIGRSKLFEWRGGFMSNQQIVLFLVALSRRTDLKNLWLEDVPIPSGFVPEFLEILIQLRGLEQITLIRVIDSVAVGIMPEVDAALDKFLLNLQKHTNLRSIFIDVSPTPQAIEQFQKMRLHNRITLRAGGQEYTSARPMPKPSKRGTHGATPDSKRARAAAANTAQEEEDEEDEEDEDDDSEETEDDKPEAGRDAAAAHDKDKTSPKEIKGKHAKAKAKATAPDPPAPSVLPPSVPITPAPIHAAPSPSTGLPVAPAPASAPTPISAPASASASAPALKAAKPKATVAAVAPAAPVRGRLASEDAASSANGVGTASSGKDKRAPHSSLHEHSPELFEVQPADRAAPPSTHRLAGQQQHDAVRAPAAPASSGLGPATTGATARESIASSDAASRVRMAVPASSGGGLTGVGAPIAAPAVEKVELGPRGVARFCPRASPLAVLCFREGRTVRLACHHCSAPLAPDTKVTVCVAQAYHILHDEFAMYCDRPTCARARCDRCGLCDRISAKTQLRALSSNALMACDACRGRGNPKEQQTRYALNEFVVHRGACPHEMVPCARCGLSLPRGRTSEHQATCS